MRCSKVLTVTLLVVFLPIWSTINFQSLGCSLNCREVVKVRQKFCLFLRPWLAEPSRSCCLGCGTVGGVCLVSALAFLVAMPTQWLTVSPARAIRLITHHKTMIIRRWTHGVLGELDYRFWVVVKALHSLGWLGVFHLPVSLAEVIEPFKRIPLKVWACNFCSLSKDQDHSNSIIDIKWLNN